MAGVKLVGEDEPYVEDRMDVENAVVAKARSATNI